LTGYLFLYGLSQSSELGVRPQKRPNTESFFHSQPRIPANKKSRWFPSGLGKDALLSCAAYVTLQIFIFAPVIRQDIYYR
jgi:hypothetical protein